MAIQLDVRILSEEYAITRLPAASYEMPSWARNDGFWAISQDGDDITVISQRGHVPPDVGCVEGWACLKLCGTFGFDEPGILLAVVKPISEAGIGVFAISTFKRDYLLIRRETLPDVKRLLAKAGHNIEEGVGES